MERKDQEREELHRAIWAIADKLRGSVDGWEFKNYVLGTMFYRFISENICNYIDNLVGIDKKEEGYRSLSDEKAEKYRKLIVEKKGFFIIPSELFCNVCEKAEYDGLLDVTLEQAFKHIEKSAKGGKAEKAFSGLFNDFDVYSNKLGFTAEKRRGRLVSLLHGVRDMNLGDVKGYSIDAFGDAYEYLMSMYVTHAGKSGGEFFTPQEVSELLTKIGTVGKSEVNKVYDPACGSGSLLLKSAKILGKDSVKNGFYGQEINATTYNLCRINMILHNIEFDKFDICCEDTLISPECWDYEPFDLIVSNPPYSIKWVGDESPSLVKDERFAPAGVLAPRNKADLAFVMHSLSFLSKRGTAAIVCFQGTMYRQGGEEKIRKYLVDSNYIDAVIWMPNNLFYATSVSTCILVMKKNKTDDKVLFMDASGECVKVIGNNKLTERNINHITKVYGERKEIKGFSRLVSKEDIVSYEYNLSVPLYVKQEGTEAVLDAARLKKKIEDIVEWEQILRGTVDKTIARDPEVKISKRLKEACPYGIPYMELGNILKMRHGKSYAELPEGKYPVYGSGGIIAHVSEYTYDKPSVIIPRKGSLDKLYYVEKPFWNSDTVFYTIINTEKVIPKYVFYCLQKEHLEKYNTSGGVPSLTQKVLKKIKIPVPPLRIQQEIVELLDSMEYLMNEMENEMNYRKKQFEYYRDKFLLSE